MSERSEQYLDVLCDKCGKTPMYCTCSYQEDRFRGKIHEITSLLARRVVGEASKKNLDGAVVVDFNTKADKDILDLFPTEKRIAQRVRTFMEEGCWIDKEALEQMFICPTIDCLECFLQHGIIDLFPSTDTLPKCGTCGGEMSKNPHPKAGKPPYYLEVGTKNVCIPCTVLSRHQWANRAMEAEGQIEKTKKQIVKEIINWLESHRAQTEPPNGIYILPLSEVKQLKSGNISKPREGVVFGRPTED